MQNKPFRFGPVALTDTLTTNILNPAVTSLAGPVGITLSQPYILLHHIFILNKTASPATFSLWIGATGANAAGTEFWGTAMNVPANSGVHYYAARGVRLDAADFLVGGASAATTLTIHGEGEVGFS